MQRNAFQLTINNPVEYGYTHEKIKETLIMNFTTLKYLLLVVKRGQGTVSYISMLSFLLEFVGRSEEKI